MHFITLLYFSKPAFQFFDSMNAVVLSTACKLRLHWPGPVLARTLHQFRGSCIMPWTENLQPSEELAIDYLVSSIKMMTYYN